MCSPPSGTLAHTVDLGYTTHTSVLRPAGQRDNYAGQSRDARWFLEVLIKKPIPIEDHIFECKGVMAINLIYSDKHYKHSS